MDIKSTEVSKGFVYLHFTEKGYGIFINQMEAFGSLLFKAGSRVEYDKATTSIKYEGDSREHQAHLIQLTFMHSNTEECSHDGYLKRGIASNSMPFCTQTSPLNVGEQWPNLLKLPLWDVSGVSDFALHASQSCNDNGSVINVPFTVPRASEYKQSKVQVDDFADTRSDNPTPDQLCDIALSNIDGIHPKVKQFLLRNSAMGQESLPLTRNEVLDYLTLFPIILVQDDGKLYCVAGIQSYLYAVSVLDKKQTVPVRWYKGKMGKALHRLNMMESLGLPIIFSTKKCLLQQTFDTLRPSFDPLYKQSFLASCSSKQFATLFGLDTRTIQEGGR